MKESDRNLVVDIFLFITILFIAFTLVFTFLVCYLKLRLWLYEAKNRQRIISETKPNLDKKPPLIIGFFHPYCNAGGGGERVLWTAIREIQKSYPHVISVVYTGDTDVTKDQILEKVKARFNISLDPNTVTFEYLHTRHWVEDTRYPRFTLLGQSLGSMVLGWDAIGNCCVPDIYFDTMGYAFTYPLVRGLVSPYIMAYVHYPTISTDMINKVQSRASSHNNSSLIAQNTALSFGKLIYYRTFAKFYRLCGNFADIAMVNSTWTKNHIDDIWWWNASIVYPPCDTTELAKQRLEGRERIIVSVAQFRPEKDHLLQLQSFKKLLDIRPSWRDGKDRVQLILIGSSRNQTDAERIQSLKDEAQKLNIEQNVHFEINVSYPILVSWLSRAKVGLHTMWNEHFGIGIVEYQAAGCIPVVHDSGGPKLDIVVDYQGEKTGYRATTAEEFANAIATILELSEQEYLKIAGNARESAITKFSEEVFTRRLFESLVRVPILGMPEGWEYNQ